MSQVNPGIARSISTIFFRTGWDRSPVKTTILSKLMMTSVAVRPFNRNQERPDRRDVIGPHAMGHQP